MWPFAAKRRHRDRDAARRDATSLGNLLIKTSMISAEQLQEALNYQEENPDRLLGEALITLGILEKEIVEALLATQKVKRSSKKRSQELQQVIQIAKNRKRPLQEAHARVVRAAMGLTTVK